MIKYIPYLSRGKELMVLAETDPEVVMDHLFDEYNKAVEDYEKDHYKSMIKIHQENGKMILIAPENPIPYNENLMGKPFFE